MISSVPLYSDMNVQDRPPRSVNPECVVELDPLTTKHESYWVEKPSMYLKNFIVGSSVVHLSSSHLTKPY